MLPTYILKFGFFVFLLLISNNLLSQTVQNNTGPFDRDNQLIGAVAVTGSSVFDKQHFLSAYFDLIGTSASDASFKKIKNRIIALYGENGYYLPKVDLSVHPEFDNVFVFAVIEPVLHGSVIEGGSRANQLQAKAFLDSFIGVPTPSVESFNQLQDILQDHLRLNVELKPRHAAGTQRDFDIVVDIQGTVNSNVTVSNTGSDQLGRTVLFANLFLNDVIPGFDEFYVNTFNTVETDGYRSLGTGALFKLGQRNELLFDANFSLTTIEDSASSNDIELKTNSYTLGWRFLLGNNANTYSAITTSLLARDFTIEDDSLQLDEKLRMAEINYQAFSSIGKLPVGWSVNVRQGLDSMGAETTGPLTDTTIENDFTLYNIWMYVDIPLFIQLNLRVDLQGQQSDNILPFSQRFTIAKNSIAPAFDSGEINGDSGSGVKLELSRWFDLPSFNSRWSPYVFYGTGQVKDNASEQTIKAGSSGLGAQLIGNSFSTYIEVSKPLKEESIYRGSSPRVKASFSYYF